MTVRTGFGGAHTVGRRRPRTNLRPAATWTRVAPGPVVVNGRNTVNTAISRAQQFYRLNR